MTNTSGVHERNAKWSPDGKTIAFISDARVKMKSAIQPRMAAKRPKQITTGADTYKYDIAWSPDGKKILWGDKKFRLQFVDVATKKVTPVTQAKAWEIREYVWSPDSQMDCLVAQDESDSLTRFTSTRWNRTRRGT